MTTTRVGAVAGPNVLIVLAHPSEDSLNASIAAAAATAAARHGATVKLTDLYRDGFDPRLHAGEVDSAAFADELTAGYARDLLAADLLVIVHPLWFFQAPAVLKGWVDRVVREDVAFELDEAGNVTGLLGLAAALVITTGNSSTDVENRVFGDPVTRFWRDVVLTPAGAGSFERLAFTPVRGSTAEKRAGWQNAAAEAVTRLVATL